jgi:hypothetical protein
VVSKFGSELRQERTLLSELEQRIADDEVKKMLPSPATLRLDQVEGFVLDEMPTDHLPRRSLSNRVEQVECELASWSNARGVRRKQGALQARRYRFFVRVRSATLRRNLFGADFSSSSARAVGLS